LGPPHCHHKAAQQILLPPPPNTSFIQAQAGLLKEEYYLQETECLKKKNPSLLVIREIETTNRAQEGCNPSFKPERGIWLPDLGSADESI